MYLGSVSHFPGLSHPAILSNRTALPISLHFAIENKGGRQGHLAQRLETPSACPQLNFSLCYSLVSIAFRARFEFRSQIQ